MIKTKNVCSEIVCCETGSTWFEDLTYYPATLENRPVSILQTEVLCEKKVLIEFVFLDKDLS